MPLRYAAPIAMIVNELVTNCFKHAFPDQRFGSVTVRYGVADGAFHLAVVDDGIGMPGEGKREGRGLNTVRALAADLGGSASWRSEDGGTTASVRFPYHAGATSSEGAARHS
jgi:two-component sensor histidine kinase